ncbi:MAG: hypothetical protein JSV83_04160 [Desulfobacterales bacterium]|nr:MAG: hypothetical protein JSV83_04160 [Desulfobacterales bacterium]
MSSAEVIRKDLDNQQFLGLRQNTEKISEVLKKRLNEHLDVLRPLFIPRKLLGTYIESASTDEVHGSDKAFAELQEYFAAICEDPFGLPKKLRSPLPPISNQIDAVPYQYALYVGEKKGKATSITTATRWILSYRSECPINRLTAMLSGAENRQPEDMKHSLIAHLTLVIFLKHFTSLKQLLQDLRYEVEIQELNDLGGLPVVVLEAPVETFLPPDDFILQLTQLSGIPAFQEIIDLDAVDNIPDPLKDVLKACLKG